MRRSDAIKQLKVLKKHCDDQVRMDSNKVFWMKNVKAMEIAIEDVKEEKNCLWKSIVAGSLVWIIYCIVTVKIIW